MAPIAGHIARMHHLVSRNYKLLKAAWKQAQSRIPIAARTQQAQLQAIPIRNAQPVHPIAWLKQSRSRYYGTLRAAVRQYTTSSASGANKAFSLRSQYATAVKCSTGRTPFASTLRPNLTGGTLSRTAGGYCLGSGRIGGTRYFSHMPAAPAEVVQNVSQAVRSFWISGQKAQYNGIDPNTSEKRFRAVSTLQESTSRKIKFVPKATPGSHVNFQINPTITALTPMGSVAGFSNCEDTGMPQRTLNTDGLLDVLSIDFSRALKDLTSVLKDLRSLSALGDLPITYTSSSNLRIHFPGCDGDTVENLCQELGVKRGFVTQDPEFDVFAGTEIALLFPFAPSKPASQVMSDAPSNAEPWPNQDLIQYEDMLDQGSNKYSTKSEGSNSLFEDVPLPSDELQATSDYQSMSSPREYSGPREADPLEYHGFEGIYRFIELCDSFGR